MSDRHNDGDGAELVEAQPNENQPNENQPNENQPNENQSGGEVGRTRPSTETRVAERAEAKVPPGPDRPPTEEELQRPDAGVTPDQRAHADEMLERGANQQGEGRIP